MNEHGLLFEAFVYLSATVLFVPIASRLGLGSVLGYLAAGCIIGPQVLGLVRDVHTIMHFSEFGVVLMLFVIGLELDPKHLWEMRRDVFGGGSLQIGLTAALLTGLGMALGLPWQGALVTGLALSLSSTAIAMQTMAERNLQASPVGRTAFAILLFQDIAAIPMIGLVPLLGAGTAAAEEGSRWISVGKAFGAIAAVVVVGLFLTRPVLRFIAKQGSRELFTAFTLLLVVGISLVMASAGVSMALGAFLAGVLLASSEYKHALETDIEPFKGLLMGLFFIAVGMSIDFALLVRAPVAIVTLVLGFVGLKALALRVLGKRLGVATKQRWLLPALISQGGEFAFVVFGVARTANLLPGDWDARLTLAVALSMALTPILVMTHDRAAARSATTAAKEFDTIEAEDAPVLIAGFGRFGQIVGRLLFASGLRATVLDHDPDQIEMLRKFGFRIFYGDATRLDLLHAAGAEKAKVLVVAIDDIQDNLALVDLAKQHFPNLTIIARARDVPHYYELRRRGVTMLERETFASALLAGRRALEQLGVGAYEARERAERFKRHNVAMLEAIFEHFDDEAWRISAARAGRDQLEQQFQRDRDALDRFGTAAWHEEDERRALHDERSATTTDAE